MLDQLINNVEERERCAEIIFLLSRKDYNGHLLIVEGATASGKTCFGRALYNFLRTCGKDVGFIETRNKGPTFYIIPEKDGQHILYEKPSGASIDFSDIERTTTIHLDACFLGKTQREPKDVIEALTEDFSRIVESGRENVYVVVDGDGMTAPLAICSTREKASEFAERIIEEECAGQRHIQGDVKTASVMILKTPLDRRIEMAGVICWDALSAGDR